MKTMQILCLFSFLFAVALGINESNNLAVTFEQHPKNNPYIKARSFTTLLDTGRDNKSMFGGIGIVMSTVCDESLKFGRNFKEGEEHRANHLIYKCQHGFMHPIGCFVDNKDLEPGQSFIDEATNSRHECFRRGSLIGYGYTSPSSIH